VAPGHAAPAIAGPGAASLRKFSLDRVVIRGWPPLPSLRSLSLDSVAVEAPFAPGAWCPRLDELDIFCSRIEHARVDICLPLLRFIDLDEVDVSPDGRSGGAPSGEITIDAPELLELDVTCNAGSTTDYKSFRLRAPRLRLLCWANQFAERVAIDGRQAGQRHGGGDPAEVGLHARDEVLPGADDADAEGAAPGPAEGEHRRRRKVGLGHTAHLQRFLHSSTALQQIVLEPLICL
jgi:hypothetical protein